MNFEVEFFENNGKCPVAEFILTLDGNTQRKIQQEIEYLKIEGNMLGMPFSKALENGIFELRVKSQNTVRILYFFTKGRTVVMTNGFTKKTQKTPSKQIELAKLYMKEYYSEVKNNEVG